MEIPTTPFSEQGEPLTARSSYDKKRRALGRLTMMLIRNLDVTQIELLRLDWRHYKDHMVSLPEFVKLLLNYCRPDMLLTTLELLVQALAELFSSMKLSDSRRKLLSFDTFLGTILHMGNNHLQQTDIRPYVPGS